MIDLSAVDLARLIVDLSNLSPTEILARFKPEN